MKTLLNVCSVVVLVVAVGIAVTGCRDEEETKTSQPAGEKSGAQLTAETSAVIAQTTCPVMGGKINKDIYVDHGGKRIYLCCPACISAFKKSPEKHISKMKEQGIELADAPGGAAEDHEGHAH